MTAQPQDEVDPRFRAIRERVQRGRMFPQASPTNQPDGPQEAPEDETGPEPRRTISMPPAALLSVLLLLMGAMVGAFGAGMLIAALLGALAGMGAGLTTFGIALFTIGVLLGLNN